MWAYGKDLGVVSRVLSLCQSRAGSFRVVVDIDIALCWQIWQAGKNDSEQRMRPVFPFLTPPIVVEEKTRAHRSQVFAATIVVEKEMTPVYRSQALIGAILGE